MIEVRFNHDETEIELNVDGHAGQNVFGKDIVCSATSILTYTVAQCVEDMYCCDKLNKEPVSELSEGKASIKIEPKPEAFNEAFITFKSAMTGFYLLAHNYPEYVCIKKFGED